MILSENDLSDPLMGNPSAPLSAPPEYPYLDDHPCKIKKNPLFDISDFNCINHDPEHGCAGFWQKCIKCKCLCYIYQIQIHLN